MVEMSLSKGNLNQDRYHFINSYCSEEQENAELKKYLDLNRFALAIRCKLNNEKRLSEKLKKEIDYSNLNWKQKVLLHCPKFLLQLIKRIQHYFKKQGIYLTSYN